MEFGRQAIHVWLFIFFASFQDDGVQCVNISGLMKELFTDYYMETRPICDVDQPIQVKIGMAVRQIVDLNEPRQIIEVNAWVRLRWSDCHLSWNKTQYGVDSIVVPFGKIWTPDITLYDNAGHLLAGFKDYRQNVYSDGSIAYNFPTVIRSLCRVDVTYFPFDTQKCKLTFGSWAHHGLELNLSQRAEVGDISSYVPNGEWSIAGVPVVRHVLLYGCCPEPYPDVTFYLVLVRKPLFYLLNLLFPCTLISTVAILGFLLPPDSGEKVSLEITVLLSLAVFLLVVSETLPPSSETFPFIGVYFACAMFLVSLSCLMTVIVLNLHFKGTHGRRMPRWVRTIFLDFFGKLVCVNKMTTAQRQRRFSVHPMTTNQYAANHINMSTVVENHGTVENGIANGHIVQQDETQVKPDMPDRSPHILDVTDLDQPKDIYHSLHKQLQILRNIEEYMMHKRTLEDTVDDWQCCARVLDRLFLVVFFIIQVSTTVGILVHISRADSFDVTDDL